MLHKVTVYNVGLSAFCLAFLVIVGCMVLHKVTVYNMGLGAFKGRRE